SLRYLLLGVAGAVISPRRVEAKQIDQIGSRLAEFGWVAAYLPIARVAKQQPQLLVEYGEAGVDLVDTLEQRGIDACHMEPVVPHGHSLFFRTTIRQSFALVVKGWRPTGATR